MAWEFRVCEEHWRMLDAGARAEFRLTDGVGNGGLVVMGSDLPPELIDARVTQDGWNAQGKRLQRLTLTTKDELGVERDAEVTLSLEIATSLATLLGGLRP